MYLIFLYDLGRSLCHLFHANDPWIVKGNFFSKATFLTFFDIFLAQFFQLLLELFSCSVKVTFILNQKQNKGQNWLVVHHSQKS